MKHLLGAKLTEKFGNSNGIRGNVTEKTHV